MVGTHPQLHLADPSCATYPIVIHCASCKQDSERENQSLAAMKRS
jgi:hypothetical protein